LKIVLIDVKDKNSFLATFEKAGYAVEAGPHTVLYDHSELATYTVKKNGEEVAIVIIHYISKYYRVELENPGSDEEYLHRLLELKYSESDWGIPASPVILVAVKDEIISLLENYTDNYPVEDGERLVNEYRSRNPSYANMVKLMLARILESLSSKTL